jgi:hypothetical protein
LPDEATILDSEPTVHLTYAAQFVDSPAITISPTLR